jgi:hypothetical protein
VSLLTALTALIISGNSGVTGSVPSTLGALRNLQCVGEPSPAHCAFCYFRVKQLCGSHTTMCTCACSVRRVLDLRLNKLSGSLPTALTRLTALQRLLLTGNELTGALPAGVGAMAALQCVCL